MYTPATANRSETFVLGILQSATKAQWQVVHYEGGPTRCYVTCDNYPNAADISAKMRAVLKCETARSLINFPDPDHPQQVIIPTSYITDNNLGMLRDSGELLSPLFQPSGSPPQQRDFP